MLKKYNITLPGNSLPLFKMLVISVLFLSCNNEKRIDDLVNSPSTCEQISGYLKINKENYTRFHSSLLQTSRQDKKIDHCTKHYGKNVRWAKIKALEKITETKLPYEYTAFTLDSTAFDFYRYLLLAKE